MKQLQTSRGCGSNRDIMVELVKTIEQKPTGTDKLLEFLRQQYPYVLLDGEAPVKATPTAAAVVAPATTIPIFEYYNPQLLTYPRRLIMEGPDLQQNVQYFLADKLQSDYVIVDNLAYIEYLLMGDTLVKSQIPASNWQIAKWRMLTGKT